MLGDGDVLAEKYRIVRMIGRGGMGAVYEVHHELIGKRLALKILWPDLTGNEEAVQRFTQEARAAAAIGHPSIIDVHDLGRAEDGSLFLVMELLDGQSLGQLLRETPVLEVSTAAYVMCQVLSALDAAHGKGIIHRDLKPDNIFLVDRGQALPAVKLLDFGVSKITGSHAPQLVETRSGTTLGTPFYMSPEQAQGARDIDRRSDVWSAGVILYELLTGERPFVADSLPALMSDVIAGTPRRPLELSPDLPSELENVILTALCKRKEDRYVTAGRMLDALLPFVEEHARGHLALSKRESVERAQRASRERQPEPEKSDSEPDTEEATDTLDEGDVIVREADLTAEPTSRETPEAKSEPPAGTDMAWQSALLENAGRSRRGVLVAAVVGCVVLLGGLAVWILGSGGAPKEGSTPPEMTHQSARRAAEVGRATQRGTVASTPFVTITVKGAPDGAQLLVDGAHVEGVVLKRRRSAEPHELRVEAKGFEPWERPVSFDRDATIDVTLMAASRPDVDAGPSTVTGEPANARIEAPAARRTEPRETRAKTSRPARPTATPGDERAPPPPSATKQSAPRELEPDTHNPYGAN